MQWISHLKSRILDVFRSIDRDQDGRITHKEFIDSVLASSEHYINIYLHNICLGEYPYAKICVHVFNFNI